MRESKGIPYFLIVSQGNVPESASFRQSTADDSGRFRRVCGGERPIGYSMLGSMFNVSLASGAAKRLILSVSFQAPARNGRCQFQVQVGHVLLQ